MPLYMQQVAYDPDAWAALAQNPEDRREAFGRLAESMGGRLLAFYNSFGGYMAGAKNYFRLRVEAQG